MKSQEILSRITERLDALNLTAHQASVAAGTPDAIRNLKRAVEKGEERPPKTATLERLAIVLQTTPLWLQTGRGEEDASHEHLEGAIKVLGKVAAGVWHEMDGNEWDDPDGKPSSTFPPDLRFPLAAQFDLQVEGTSINLIAPEGHFLRCVDFAASGLDVRTDDLVIVRRIKDSSLVEMTAKVAKVTRGKIELWPRSSDPRWQDKVVIPQGGQDQHEEIQIIAIVLFNYAPTLRR